MTAVQRIINGTVLFVSGFMAYASIVAASLMTLVVKNIASLEAAVMISLILGGLFFAWLYDQLTAHAREADKEADKEVSKGGFSLFETALCVSLIGVFGLWPLAMWVI